MPEALGVALVDAVIVDYHAGADLLACLESLQPSPKSITVVDNAGDGTSQSTLGTRWPGVWVVEPGMNLGFGAGIEEQRSAMLPTCWLPIPTSCSTTVPWTS